MGTRGGNSEVTRNHKGWQKVIFRYLFSTPDSERFAFLVVSGQSGFAACPPLRKLLKPSGEQALRPDYISFLGVLNNYIFSTINIVCNRKDRWKQEEESK
jgi:hypothetical protein